MSVNARRYPLRAYYTRYTRRWIFFIIFEAFDKFAVVIHIYSSFRERPNSSEEGRNWAMYPRASGQFEGSRSIIIRVRLR